MISPGLVRHAARSLALLTPLLGGSCAAVQANQQGPLQPQAVAGPCTVKRFFLLGERSVPVEMAVGNRGQACSFVLFNPDLQLTLTAALVTGQPAHGQASAALVNGGRQAVISYVPSPGYAGPDRFSATVEPHAVGVTVDVGVSPPG